MQMQNSVDIYLLDIPCPNPQFLRAYFPYAGLWDMPDLYHKKSFHKVGIKYETESPIINSPSL